MDIEQNYSNHEHASTSLKVILLVFAIVLVATLGYLVWDANNTPTPSDSTTTPISTKKNTTEEKADEKKLECADPKSGEKNYTTTNNGFCFNYPSAWILTDQADAENGIAWRVSLTDKVVPNSDYQGKMLISAYTNIAKLDTENTGAKTVKEYLDDYAAMDEPVFENITPVKIGGIDGYICKELSLISDDTVVYFFPLGNDSIIKISLFARDEETTNIIDTFQFNQY